MNKSLEKFRWLVKGSLIKYVLGLILSQERKYCTKIAKFFGVSHDSIYNFFLKNSDFAALFPDLMIKLAQYFHSKNNGWLIIDDTALSKIYAKYIEGIHWVYNSSLGRPERGLCIVVIAWTDGDMIIPIGFDWWFSKEISPEKYATKIEIAQRLIGQIIPKTNFRKLLSDAGYISVDMINFLKSLNIEFVTRIHSNRKISTSDGICEQMKNHPNLKLNRNLRAKIVKVILQNTAVNIVVFKRKKKNSNEYDKVFLVTNIDATANEIIKMYNSRWEIEPMFRAMKQSFGLMQCSARSLEKQSLHIKAVFLGFAFIQREKNRKNFLCSEDAIRHLQNLKMSSVTNSFTRFCRDLCYVA